MIFKAATITIEQKDIEEAIRQRVIAAGWMCGKVTIHCHPHQHNGPDSFTATAEVQPKQEAGSPGHSYWATCKDCGKEIKWDGLRWSHCGLAQPRHPAQPSHPWS